MVWVSQGGQRGQWAWEALTVFTDIVGGTVPLLGPALLVVATLTGGADRVLCVTAFRDQLFPCNRGGEKGARRGKRASPSPGSSSASGIWEYWQR